MDNKIAHKITVFWSKTIEDNIVEQYDKLRTKILKYFWIKIGEKLVKIDLTN